MKITPPRTTRDPLRTGGENKRTLSAGKVLLIALAAAAFSGLLAYKLTQTYFPTGFKTGLWSIAEQDYGFRFYQKNDNDSLRQALLRVPKRLTRHIDIPKIHIDIGFTELQKLYAQREQALKARILVQGEDDWVPASIRSGGETVKVKLRLKGDWVDHLEGDKWSFRIHTKGQSQLFGMRRFSIQHPVTRGYQGEILFQETLRQYGVLTPRYSFVEVVVNGDSIGIMALEEHFSKELLENNGRKEGVIIRYNESLAWEGRLRGPEHVGEVFETYLNAPIDAFGMSRIRKSERLSREYAVAVGLLRGFTSGQLRPSEVFDVDLLGSYLAVAEFWGADHDAIWHNQRFYLNPLTLKLEPVAFDANIHHRRPVGSSINHLPIVRQMLADPVIAAAFQRTLDDLVAQVENGQLIRHLQQVEKPHLETLQKDFVLLESFNYEELPMRARQLPDWTRPEIKPEIHPVFVHAHLITDSGGPYLELSNALPHPVEIQSIQWVDETGGSLPFQPATPLEFPMVLPATPLHTLPELQRIDYQPLSNKVVYRLEVKANIQGYAETRTAVAGEYFPALQANPMPAADITTLLASHAFLSLQADTRTVLASPGTWQVTGDIVVPPGYTLEIPAGTTLQFETDGSLVVYGTTRLQGTADAPVVLEGMPADSGSWQGVAVYYAPARSEWSHVMVRNTTGMDWPEWKLTGGITFYRSNADISESTLSGNQGEDALNIIHSDFSLHEVNIYDTASDAFDADFTTGNVSGGTFRDIGKAGGGDGLDISGSNVTISGTRFERVNDKAISVGEGSTLSALNIIAENCGVGAASKDRSSLEISDSTISNARNAALMAYMKKPEYGPATLVASNIRILDTATPAQVEKGSRLELNGEQVNPEDLDVKKLYKTIMKPGISR